jgi:hypothetical protein
MQPALTKADPAEIVVPENGLPTAPLPKIEVSPNNASKHEPEHDEDGEDWEEASLYEEVLDDTSPYDYPFSESVQASLVIMLRPDHSRRKP